MLRTFQMSLVYKAKISDVVNLLHDIYEGRFYVRRVEDIMKIANFKVNAYIMYIFGKIELLSIHAA